MTIAVPSPGDVSSSPQNPPSQTPLCTSFPCPNQPETDTKVDKLQLLEAHSNQVLPRDSKSDLDLAGLATREPESDTNFTQQRQRWAL